MKYNALAEALMDAVVHQGISAVYREASDGHRYWSFLNPGWARRETRVREEIFTWEDDSHTKSIILVLKVQQGLIWPPDGQQLPRGRHRLRE